MDKKNTWENAEDMKQLEQVTDHIDEQNKKLGKTTDPTKIQQIQNDIEKAEEYLEAEADKFIEKKPEAEA